MGRHNVQSSTKKIAPSIVLLFSIFSVVSPIALLFTDQEATANGTVISTRETIQDLDPDLNLVITPKITKVAEHPSAPARKKQTQTHVPPSQVRKSASVKLTPAPTPRRTSQPSRAASRAVARPTPTTTPSPTSRAPARPSPAARQATTSPVPPSRASSRVTPTPTPTSQQIVRSTTKPTTTTATPSSAQKPTTTPTPTPTTQNLTSSSGVERIVPVAKRYVGRGIPYVMGGNSLTAGMDCSHFVWMVLKEAGLRVPYRSSSALAAWTKRTSTPRPGDLVLYSGHVGIYAGNGMMVHHGKPGGAFFVKVYTQGLIGYGRIPI